MSKELDNIISNLEDFMRDNNLTIVATAGEGNRLCISHYNGESFEDIQFEEEINPYELLVKLRG